MKYNITSCDFQLEHVHLMNDNYTEEQYHVSVVLVMALITSNCEELFWLCVAICVSICNMTVC